MRNYLSLIFLFFFLPIASFSQFGKNKMQYQDFHWKYIQTPHFDIYFHDDSRILANFTAQVAENALSSIQKTLRYKISRRIPIIVYNSHNQFQQTNVINMFLPRGIGGVTELFKNRVVVPFQGDYEQFRHVIHHELVHGVINEMFYGGTFQSAISRGNLVEIPIWMNEGLCEWESIGGLDILTDVFIRDLILSENLPDLRYLDGYLAYRGGQAFWWYVSEKYGAYKISELLTKLRSTGSLENAFKSTFNTKFEDFSEEWRLYLKKYYYPDIEKFQYPSDFAIRLTNHQKEGNFYNTSPAFSPNTNKVAYISDRDGLFSLFLMDLDKDNKTEELVRSFRQQDFEELNVLTPGISWSPDGMFLAVSAKFRGEDVIYIVDVATKKYQKIKLGFNQLTTVSWSPNGEEIVFSATSFDKTDLNIYNMKSKQIKRLMEDYFYDEYPVWSPDGTKIYFISDREDNVNTVEAKEVLPWKIASGSRDIFEYDLKSKSIRRLTFSPKFAKTSLAVDREGRNLFFISDENGIGNIYRLDLSSLQITPVTNSLSNITHISISSATNDIVFSALSNGGFDLFLLKSTQVEKNKFDSLPKTKLRISTLLNDIEIAKDDENIVRDAVVEAQDTVSYGGFFVDFSRQSMVKPSQDVSMVESEFRKFSLDTLLIDYEYKIKFTPDIILGNPSYNSFWGYQGIAQMLFSDILGDHQIYLEANLWVDLKNSNFFVQYSYLPNIIDYNFYAYHSSLFFFAYYNNSYDWYRLRNYGVGVNASYPMSMFRRIEFNLNFFNALRENTTNPYEPTLSRTILFPELRYVYDDVLYGSFAPVRGTRYYVEFKALPKLFSSSINFYTLKFDFRRYFDFGYFLKFAFRGTGAKSFGPDAQKFFLGGTENWINYSIKNDRLIFENPEDFAFMELITPLRGWSYAEIVGTQYFATNWEFRFPLFTALLPGPVPILFNDILGVAFFDLGGAWSGDLKDFKATIPNHLLMSAGVGARAWILGLPIKLDIAWRNEIHNWSKPFYIVSINYDF